MGYYWFVAIVKNSNYHSLLRLYYLLIYLFTSFSLLIYFVMFFICYYYYYYFKSFLTSESIYIRPSHGLWKTTIMLVYAPNFLEKQGQYFMSLVLILCKVFLFIYTEKGKIYYTWCIYRKFCFTLRVRLDIIENTLAKLF